MSFISDRKQMRTWDPERGWELLVRPAGKGESIFTLRHSLNPPISFWGATKSLDYTGQTLADGRPEVKQVFQLDAVNERSPLEAAPEQLELIKDALQAYGLAHTGPYGPVELEVNQ